MTVDLAKSTTSYAATDAAALRQVLRTVTAESCPKVFNFHMHTVYSDGRLTPEQLIDQALSIGLQGFAITDHHSIQGYYRAQAHLAQCQPTEGDRSLPQLWSGVEINAKLLNEEVHILGYAFQPHHAALEPYLQQGTTTGLAYQAAQVIAAIQTAGGVAVLAHPARYRRSPRELIPAAAALGIDGVEAYYAYANPSPWQPSPRQTAEVSSLGDQHRLLKTCGTDTHGMSLLHRL
ncbi:MAG: PHP domain-containing protein [Elainella sp. Prado103]|jgi:hypothetical protein|nr:PHP domain-containing protein [Elainella sp. Prado103]